MRVLIASKFWYLRGGLERVMFDEVASLTSHGHAVAAFSTAHPANEPSPWSHYFAPYIELGADSDATRTDRLTAALRMFRNREAGRRFGALLSEFLPDVIHVHGIHRQLSPSILAVAHARGIPVVQTVHDYHHVCPNDVLLRGGTTPCKPRSCRVYDYSAAISNRCVRGSVALSSLSAAETAFQRLTHAYDRISCFVCPSDFMAEAMKSGGWRVPITVLRNSVALPSAQVAAPGDHFVFTGRLSPEKGVEVALEAAQRAGVRIVVAGTGPSRAHLESRFPDVEFVGHVDADGVNQLLLGCRAAIVPSIWFENAPLSVLEPMALGVPVVASRIGGIAEMIEDGHDGVLVTPNDITELTIALERLSSDPVFTSRLGERARERVKVHNDPEVHYEGLLEIYTRAIEGGSTT